MIFNSKTDTDIDEIRSVNTCIYIEENCNKNKGTPYRMEREKLFL